MTPAARRAVASEPLNSVPSRLIDSPRVVNCVFEPRQRRRVEPTFLALSPCSSQTKPQRLVRDCAGQGTTSS